jgi:hypothetical protein
MIKSSNPKLFAKLFGVAKLQPHRFGDVKRRAMLPVGRLLGVQEELHI